VKKAHSTNIVTDEALEYGLEVRLTGATAIDTWYVAPFTSATAPASTYTYATPVLTEFTDYTADTRRQWQYGSVTSLTLSNSLNRASFTMTTAVDIYGGFMVGGGTAATTKDDTAGGGILFCASLFDDNDYITLASDDILKIQITITEESL
jgi:hypothetical protein